VVVVDAVLVVLIVPLEVISVVKVVGDPILKRGKGKISQL
jgi:hypothetical protein